MQKKYTIPFCSMSGGNNKQTIKTAIEQLQGKYLVDFEVMNESDRIKLLECITNLTDIYLNIKQAEVKQ